MFFFEYQIEALRVLWDTGGDLGSRDIWEGVNNRFGKISRASIINFLNEMYEEDIISGYQTTGKGGSRMIYSARFSENELKAYLAKLVKEKMDDFIKQ